eukprot:1144190-Pelagomonas_calceolata.AAC.1
MVVLQMMTSMAYAHWLSMSSVRLLVDPTPVRWLADSSAAPLTKSMMMVLQTMTNTMNASVKRLYVTVWATRRTTFSGGRWRSCTHRIAGVQVAAYVRHSVKCTAHHVNGRQVAPLHTGPQNHRGKRPSSQTAGLLARSSESQSSHPTSLCRGNAKYMTHLAPVIVHNVYIWIWVSGGACAEAVQRSEWRGSAFRGSDFVVSQACQSYEVMGGAGGACAEV